MTSPGPPPRRPTPVPTLSHLEGCEKPGADAPSFASRGEADRSKRGSRTYGRTHRWCKTRPESAASRPGWPAVTGHKFSANIPFSKHTHHVTHVHNGSHFKNCETVSNGLHFRHILGYAP